MGNGVALRNQLISVGKEGQHVPLHLARGDTVQAQLVDIGDRLCHSLLPSVRFGHHIEAAHGAPLAGAVELVKIYECECRAVALSASVEADL